MDNAILKEATRKTRKPGQETAGSIRDHRRVGDVRASGVPGTSPTEIDAETSTKWNGKAAQQHGYKTQILSRGKWINFGGHHSVGNRANHRPTLSKQNSSVRQPVSAI